MITRRDIVATSVAGAVFAATGERGGEAQPADTEVERTASRIVGFSSGELDFQLMRSLGAANYGGCAPGEVFAAQALIKDNDPYGWPPAFAELGSRVENVGREALARKHPVSARDHFLRASMYFRAAEYFADPFGTEGREWGMTSRAAFLEAAKLLPDRIEAVEVPFEGKGLPGYFMVPASGCRTRQDHRRPDRFRWHR